LRLSPESDRYSEVRHPRLVEASLRIGRESTGLPGGDVDAYEKLMSRLDAFYGPLSAKTAQ
jgi:hypothetical protein